MRKGRQTGDTTRRKSFLAKRPSAEKAESCLSLYVASALEKLGFVRKVWSYFSNPIFNLQIRSLFCVNKQLTIGLGYTFEPSRVYASF